VKRAGLIIPSSNVVIEDMLHSRAVSCADEIGIHIARLPVTRVDLGADSKKQFDADVVEQAIDQLLEAQVDQIVFAGTAGAWLGIERERRWCSDVARRAGIAVTSTTLLTLEKLKTTRFNSLGLVTPFTAKVHRAIVQNFKSEGLSIGEGCNFELDSSRQMADLELEQIANSIAGCFESGCDAVLCFCTNFRGFEAVRLEVKPDARFHVLDSVQLTLESVGVVFSSE
jgi:maleate cis-trans isomerase